MLTRLTSDQRNQTIDLRPFMDTSPLFAPMTMPLRRVYHLFNSVGVRHLPILGDSMELVGIVVRKDIVPQLLFQRVRASKERKLNSRQIALRRSLTRSLTRKLPKMRKASVAPAHDPAEVVENTLKLWQSSTYASKEKPLRTASGRLLLRRVARRVFYSKARD